MAAGNANPEVYEACISFYDAIMRHMGWKDIGRILPTGVMIPDYIKDTPWQEKPRLLGASL